jgi:hypothetical protein
VLSCASAGKEQMPMIARNTRIETFRRMLSSRSTYGCRAPEFEECDEKPGFRAGYHFFAEN